MGKGGGGSSKRFTRGIMMGFGGLKGTEADGDMGSGGGSNVVGNTDRSSVVPVTNYGQSIVSLLPLFEDWNITTRLLARYGDTETVQKEKE